MPFRRRIALLILSLPPALFRCTFAQSIALPLSCRLALVCGHSFQSGVLVLPS
jgi:hypothetical protein